MKSTKIHPAQSDNEMDAVQQQRTVYVNDTTRNDTQRYLHNRISTAKYSFLSFWPKFLKEQFSKYANVFFLFTIGIQVRLVDGERELTDR
jgi:hypothetical protein